MKKRIILLLAGFGFGFFALSTLNAGNSFPACESFGIQKLQGKERPPLFSLKDLNGNQVALSDYSGKPVLLFFWGSWCVSCKEDIALLEKFSVGRKGQLEILTVVVDGHRESSVRRVVKRYKISLPVLLDSNEKIARTYGVTMVPTVFLIDQEGYMEGKILGQRAWDAPLAFAAVKELLNLR